MVSCRAPSTEHRAPSTEHRAPSTEHRAPSTPREQHDPAVGSSPVCFSLLPSLALLIAVFFFSNASPVQAQDPNPVYFCGFSDDWLKENGCYDTPVTYARVVNGKCTKVTTDCHDNLDGGSDDDVLRGYLGNDYLYGNEGDDLLYGGRGRDFLNGGENDDVLKGGRSKDTLVGGSGDDVLDGGRGSDQLWGGGGSDVLKGGPGADVFTYIGFPLEHNGNDVITDFEPGVDVIWLYGTTINGEFVGFTGFDALSLTLVRVGEARSDTILDLSAHGGGQVRLEGIDPADLSADDFWFYR